MLVLGLVLILAAAALGVGAVYDGGEAASVELLGTTVDTTVAGVFFTGAGTMLLFLIGVWMLTASMGRSRRKRAERKQAKLRQRESVQQLEEERAQLRAENERLSGQLDSSETSAAGVGAAGASGTRADRDRDGTPDAAETHADTSDTRTADGREDANTTDTRTGAPMRESDGPAAQRGTHARNETDLRGHETTTATRGDTTTRT